MDKSLHGVWVKCSRTGHVGRIAYQDALGFHIVYRPRGSMGSQAKPSAGYCDLDELKFLKRKREPFWPQQHGNKQLSAPDAIKQDETQVKY